MPKLKPRKAAVKRFKVTGTGKIMRFRANKKHLLEHKSRSLLRKLGKKREISGSDYSNVRKMIGV